MLSPYLTRLARTLEQAKLDQAADLAKRTLRADQLPPDLFLNFYGTWDEMEVVLHERAAQAAEGVRDYNFYRCTIQFLPDGSTRPLDLSEWADEIAREQAQNARDDERHNRTLTPAAMGGR